MLDSLPELNGTAVAPNSSSDDAMPRAAVGLLRPLVFAVLAAACASSVAATQRTFVASTGNDANPCSLALPCRQFTAAMANTAVAGEVIALDSAGYGPVFITQSVTISAPAGVHAGISVFTGDGVTIAGNNIVVVLRGLSINGQGGDNGINIVNAGTVHVENCVIANMVNGNSSSGIRQIAGSLYVNNVIVRNSAYGIYVQGPAANANLDRVRIEANATGVAAEFGGHVAMQDCTVTGNTNIGVIAAYPNAAQSRVTVTRSLIASNNIGVYVLPNLSPDVSVAMVTIADSTISENSVGIHADGNSNPVLRGVVYLTRSAVTANSKGLEVVANGAAYVDNNTLAGNSGVDVSDDATANFITRNNNVVYRSALVPSTVFALPGV